MNVAFASGKRDINFCERVSRFLFMKNKPEPNFFYVNRELLNSARWLSEKFTRGQAWIDLCGLAQHTKSYFRIRGIRVDVERGQLAYSQLSLSKRWKWSRDRTRRFLKGLEERGDIIQQNTVVTTIITIKKYDLWQGGKTTSKTTNKTTNDTTEKQQKNIKRYTYNKEKKDNKENNVKNTTISQRELGDVDKIFDLFYQSINPTINWGNTTSRKAAEELIKKLGIDKAVRTAEYAISVQGEPYAPTITTPYQLKEKFAALLVFHKKGEGGGKLIRL